MFEKEYIDFGRVTFTSCSVTVWSSWYNCRYLPNVPNGVVNAYWQGNHVVVETNSGWSYIYEEIGNYTDRWMRG